MHLLLLCVAVNAVCFIGCAEITEHENVSQISQNQFNQNQTHLQITDQIVSENETFGELMDKSVVIVSDNVSGNDDVQIASAISVGQLSETRLGSELQSTSNPLMKTTTSTKSLSVLKTTLLSSRSRGLDCKDLPKCLQQTSPNVTIRSQKAITAFSSATVKISTSDQVVDKRLYTERLLKADDEELPINFELKQKRQDGREGTDERPVLRFPAMPEGDGYHVKDLGLSEGMFLFSYLGPLISWMQPFDFPVELLRDAVWNHLSLFSLITESLKVEAGFLVCLSIGLLLSFTAPGLVVVHACCLLLRGRPRDAPSSPPPPPPPPPPTPSSAHWDEENNGDDKSGTREEGCRHALLVGLMYLILLLSAAGIVAMFVTNEQLSVAIQETPHIFQTALSDAATFLRNTHLQYHFVITQSLDHALEASTTDLDNVDDLLGRPIQRELASETGVDVALDVLMDVSKAARELADKVEALQEYTQETLTLAKGSRVRFAELRQYVAVFRRQCPGRDRPLCETVDPSGLDVVMKLEAILNDRSLREIRGLGGDNLTAVTSQARGEFQFLPQHVEKETKDLRNAIRRQLGRQRSVIDDAIWSLDAITRDLSAKVEHAREHTLKLVRRVTAVELWRWLTALGAALSVLTIWVLLLIGMVCGCLGVERHASGLLISSLIFICLFTTVLWLITLIALIIGGHGEVFVCRTLHEDPDFNTLTRLVDNPGVLYKKGGFFSNLLYSNATLDVSVREVLQKCHDNKPSYQTFRLSRVFDADAVSDHRKWGTLHADIDNLHVNLTRLQLLKPELQLQLQALLQASAVNVSNFRAQLAGQVTGKDLSSFAEQLESVSNQITDSATATRVETLVTKTRGLLDGQVKQLEQRKENIVYQLAALEVHLLPLQRQLNQSLSHFKTIQYYINNQGAQIAKRKTRVYVNRLVAYLDQFRSHVMEATHNQVALCRPIWDVFHSVRLLMCRHVMDPLNGFWFAALWCLCLLLAATPLTIQLAESYRHCQGPGRRLLNSESAESQTETLIISEQGGAWLTPGTQEPDGW